MKINLIACMLLLLLFAGIDISAQTVESNYWKIEKINIPKDIILEVGGLAFDDQGNLGVATRRGEIWILKNPGSDSPEFTRYAHGLHEPLGLRYRDGSFYCTQRGELTKLTDTNQDGKADQYEALYTWDLAGNYHEYSYGPVFTPEGDMLVTLNLGWIGRGASLSEWRGWLVKITKEGKLEPIATGLRSPAGFGYNAEGDIFYAENQGDWVGSGRMTHLEKGDFAGNPEGLRWTYREGSPLKLKPGDIDDTRGLTLYEYAQEVEELKLPAVWFPHGVMGTSTSAFLNLKEEFGAAFSGQMLVGDQGNSFVMRVAMEKVDGVYQGACFPFAKGFASGVLRLEWSPDHDAIYVGGTNRGWSSVGKDPFALERLEWTGKTPFEIKSIHAHEQGLRLEFTQPADQETLQHPDSYQITDFTFLYHHFYGSPVHDKQTRTIREITISEDGLSAVLHLDGLRKGYVYEVRAPGVRSASGQGLLHDYGYFTLNNIPGGGAAITQALTSSVQQGAGNKLDMSKNPTEMPSSWTSGPDQEITVKTLPGLKYDTEVITVKPGQKVKLTLENDDDMLHNLVITEPEQADAVGETALKLGLDGEALQYVPDMDQVLFFVKVLQPESAESIYFEVPEAPGDYQFVCTFPGHYMTMRGIIRVTTAL
jgi:azurin